MGWGLTQCEDQQFSTEHRWVDTLPDGVCVELKAQVGAPPLTRPRTLFPQWFLAFREQPAVQARALERVAVPFAKKWRTRRETRWSRTRVDCSKSMRWRSSAPT